MNMSVINRLVLVAFIFGFTPTFLNANEQAIQSGKFQYELIQRDSQMPKFGDCWTNSLKELQKGCQSLTDELQSRMALRFANCFLAQAGQKTYPCDVSEKMSDCLTGVDTNAFSAYSNFFTHTNNMCQFLQHQIWHQESQSTIEGLTKTSSKVVDTLKSSSKLQDDIIKNQLETLQYQKQIAAHGSVLNKTVEESRTAAKEMMLELKLAGQEQKTLIFSIFDRVTQLQSLLLSEVSWLYTVLFYFGCLLAIYLATATKRTADARLWLFMVISLNFALERLICSWTVKDGGEPDPFTTVYQNDESTPQAVLYYRIWLARKFTLFVSVIILCYKGMTFQDYNLINYQLLRDIQKQNDDLCRTVQILKNGGNDVVKSPNDVVDFNDEIENEEVDDEASNASDVSFDSKMTDTTWIANDFSDDEEISEVFDDESFNTAEADTTPTNLDDSNVTEIVPYNHEVINSLELKQSTPVQKRTTKNNSRCSTPVAMNGNHSYNLRQRRGEKSFINNTLLENESPDAFGRLVTQQANESKKYRQEILSQLKIESMKCPRHGVRYCTFCYNCD